VKAEHLKVHLAAPVTISGVRFSAANRLEFWLSLER